MPKKLGKRLIPQQSNVLVKKMCLQNVLHFTVQVSISPKAFVQALLDAVWVTEMHTLPNGHRDSLMGLSWCK